MQAVDSENAKKGKAGLYLVKTPRSSGETGTKADGNTGQAPFEYVFTFVTTL